MLLTINLTHTLWNEKCYGIHFGSLRILRSLVNFEKKKNLESNNFVNYTTTAS